MVIVQCKQQSPHVEALGSLTFPAPRWRALLRPLSRLLPVYLTIIRNKP